MLHVPLSLAAVRGAITRHVRNRRSLVSVLAIMTLCLALGVVAFLALPIHASGGIPTS